MYELVGARRRRVLRLEGLERLASVRVFFYACQPQATHPAVVVQFRRAQLPFCLAALACTEPASIATSVSHRRPNVRYQRHQTRHLRPMYATAARHRPIMRTRRDCSPSAREPSLTRGRNEGLQRRRGGLPRPPGCCSWLLDAVDRSCLNARPLRDAPRRRSLKVLLARPSAGAE